MTLSFFGYIPEFTFEKSFDETQLTSSADFMRSTLHIPVLLSGLYVLVIFGLQKVMEDRPAFNLRNPLAAWSLFLGLFSLCGSVRTVPALIKMIQSKGVTEVICGDTRREWLFNNPAGFWTFIFVLSKVPELIDTLFIVLRKRKLITLHWYHHITVMMFCWHSWGTHCLYGIFFAAMNLTVHAFMYVFYFLTALGYRPTSFAQSITILQIVQMLFGTLITFYAAFHMTFVVPQDILGSILSPKSLEWNLNISMYVDDSPKCHVNPGNALAGITMYTSYLWLFCVFFYYAYIHKPKPSATPAKKDN
uniref:Elongation of fatty acids protein n=1 Tax=Labyrinthula sp. ND50 TaxID=587447 RepID=B9VJL2_9STRA|nr:fatty acid elongase [Labyrinthula sp. ND50]